MASGERLMTKFDKYHKLIHHMETSKLIYKLCEPTAFTANKFCVWRADQNQNNRIKRQDQLNIMIKLHDHVVNRNLRVV